jgi:hypothetical protein
MLLAGAAYLVSLPGGFLYDDWYLFGLPDVVDPDGWKQMFRLEATRPFGILSFWASYQLSGDNAWAWRLAGILIHLVNAVLFYQAFRGAVPSDAAAWGAVLFAVHPIQVETVCYVSARPGLLSVHCILWSLLLWFRGRHYLSAAAFAVALLCKEDVVAYPVALGLMHAAWSKNRRELGAIALMFGLSVAAGLRVLFAAAVVKDSGVASDAGVSWLAYLGSQGWAWWTYLRGLLLPWGFSMEPPVEGGWLGLAAWVLCGVGLGWLVHRAMTGSRAAVWGLGGWAAAAAEFERVAGGGRRGVPADVPADGGGECGGGARGSSARWDIGAGSVAGLTDLGLEGSGAGGRSGGGGVAGRAAPVSAVGAIDGPGGGSAGAGAALGGPAGVPESAGELCPGSGRSA